MLLLSPLPLKNLSLLLVITLTLTFLRLLSILPSQKPPTPARRKRGSPTHLLILLGSGGHTAEMLSLLQDLDTRSYNRRTWVISEGDAFSAGKAAEFEKGIAGRARQKQKDKEVTQDERKRSEGEEEAEAEEKEATHTARTGTYEIKTIPRARRVHQPLFTTPISSLRCLNSCVRLLNTSKPDLILTNGPRSPVILNLAPIIIRFFTLPVIPLPLYSIHGERHRRAGGGDMRTIYVESWARVKRLSLSGRILVSLGMCNRVLVQWEGLSKKGGEFKGVLVR